MKRVFCEIDAPISYSLLRGTIYFQRKKKIKMRFSKKKKKKKKTSRTFSEWSMHVRDHF